MDKVIKELAKIDRLLKLLNPRAEIVFVSHATLFKLLSTGI